MVSGTKQDRYAWSHLLAKGRHLPAKRLNGARRSSFGQSWTCSVAAPLLYFAAVLPPRRLPLDFFVPNPAQPCCKTLGRDTGLVSWWPTFPSSHRFHDLRITSAIRWRAAGCGKSYTRLRTGLLCC